MDRHASGDCLLCRLQHQLPGDKELLVSRRSYVPHVRKCVPDTGALESIHHSLKLILLVTCSQPTCSVLRPVPHSDAAPCLPPPYPLLQQLVQWFRQADIIALGIGSVGSGPLVLLIQLGLVQVTTWPQRWQVGGG